MLTMTTNTSGKAPDTARQHSATSSGQLLPLLVSIPEARRQFGNIGNTAFYDAVKRHGIALVRLGGRSLVPTAEIERVVAELRNSASTDASDKAKALAARSVAARRAPESGNSPSPPPPIRTRKRRGNSGA